MRLFIAIEFPECIKEKLFLEGMDIKSSGFSGNYSRRENYHITLDFLGEVDYSKVNSIKRIMDSISSNKFNISISKYNTFSNGRILIREVKAPKELYDLRKKLTDDLKDNGFYIDDKPFRPHMTVARETDILKDDLGGFNSGDISVDIDSISLMSSERVNGKLCYTCLYKKYL